MNVSELIKVLSAMPSSAIVKIAIPNVERYHTIHSISTSGAGGMIEVIVKPLPGK